MPQTLRELFVEIAEQWELADAWRFFESLDYALTCTAAALDCQVNKGKTGVESGDSRPVRQRSHDRFCEEAGWYYAQALCVLRTHYPEPGQIQEYRQLLTLATGLRLSVQRIGEVWEPVRPRASQALLCIPRPAPAFKLQCEIGRIRARLKDRLEEGTTERPPRTFWGKVRGWLRRRQKEPSVR
jgi:hypothetical protein